MLPISTRVSIPESEITLQAVRSQGTGGQNVNKVATAIHLFFDIRASTLPDYYKERLLRMRDRRITDSGIIVIKAQEHRSQEKNREAALRRLQEVVRAAAASHRTRKPTRPTRSARARRVENKVQRSRIKALRRKVDSD